MRPVQGRPTVGERCGHQHGQAGGDHCRHHRPDVPGAQHDPQREQRPADRHAVDRSQSGSGGAAQQDLPVPRRQSPPCGAQVAEGDGELPRCVLPAQRGAGSHHHDLQEGVEAHRAAGQRRGPADRLVDGRHRRSSPKQPPAPAGQRRADHRPARLPDPARGGHTVEHAAEAVVIGEVLDEVEEHRRRRARDAGQQADKDDRATEFDGAAAHPAAQGSPSARRRLTTSTA